jgi:para-nitrobenzyl esterase
VGRFLGPFGCAGIILDGLGQNGGDEVNDLGQQSTAVVVETASGQLSGEQEGRVYRFRSVPFAAPPVGPLRFARPQPVTPWTGVKSAVAPAPLPPQTPSRLSRVLGDYPLDCDEDCLYLNIATPGIDDTRRPVMVWLCGGAFLTGGNAISWYDGARFASDHDIVFVGVNYRLGALGFLNLSGVSEGNLGVHDQVMSLRWVQENIAQFGGDPSNVSVVGQSAGAISTLAILAMNDTHDLFQRAIMQSGRLATLATEEASVKAGEQMLAVTDVSPSSLSTMPVEKLLELQTRFIRSGAQLGSTATPFRPFAGGDFIPDNTVQAAARGSQGKSILMGWTRDEMAAFFSGSSDVLNASNDAIDDVFRLYWGSNWEAGLAFTRARLPGAAIDDIFGHGLNECMFAGSTVAFAESLADVNPAWLYRFDWAPSASPFGACHCIDLPFMFGNTDSWEAPMLKGGGSVEMADLANRVQTTWATFMRSGDPNHEALPIWPRYQLDKRWTLRLDDILETVSDLSGATLPGRPRPKRLAACRT